MSLLKSSFVFATEKEFAKRAPASVTLKRGQNLVVCGKGSSVEEAKGALNEAINDVAAPMINS